MKQGFSAGYFKGIKIGSYQRLDNVVQFFNGVILTLVIRFTDLGVTVIAVDVASGKPYEDLTSAYEQSFSLNTGKYFDNFRVNLNKPPVTG